MRGTERHNAGGRPRDHVRPAGPGAQRLRGRLGRDEHTVGGHEHDPEPVGEARRLAGFNKIGVLQRYDVVQQHGKADAQGVQASE